jgi:Fe(3+) dicitrate transport protein
MNKQKCRIVKVSLFLCAILSPAWGLGQLSGHARFEDREAVVAAQITLNNNRYLALSDEKGYFVFKDLPKGSYTLTLSCLNCTPFQKNIEYTGAPLQLELSIQKRSNVLTQVEVSGNRVNTFNREYLSGVDEFGIYEGKKTEVIDLSKSTANLATNNARQVFAKIPGLNIWESDGAGLQLGIGGRGLSPNRTSNFNTRQNGYDISADPLGYPESYYTPPMEALERIEIVRGAASLQYGTQFGGLLNFRFHKPDTATAMSLRARLSGGSFGFRGLYTAASGSLKGTGLSYFGFFQHRAGNGWRPNSGFEVNTGYLHLRQQLSPTASLSLEYTGMDYLAQQPGGLTDTQFERDPRQSNRARNWFQVKWKLPAATLDWHLNATTAVNIRAFGMISERLALGNLERIHVADLGGNRTLIDNNFRNWGNELRILKKLHWAPQEHTLLLGARYFDGFTTALQGDADGSKQASFEYLNPQNLEGSDFKFNNANIAAFAEYIYRVSERFSITPGLRFEYIQTGAAGYFKQRVLDFAGNIVAETNIAEANARTRRLLLMGIGLSWKNKASSEFYANFSQNYRAINFNDLRVNNPNLIVDPQIGDERGFTLDAGTRGNWRNRINYDVSLFSILYRDRIGQVLRSDLPPLFLDYRYRSNVADARLSGLELYLEADLLNLSRALRGKHSLYAFVNGALIHTRYFNAQEKGIEGNRVEQAPPLNLRWGLNYRYQGFSLAFQMTHVSEHFTDASNARRVTGAVSGIIPAYQVADLSCSWKAKRYGIELSCNNLWNTFYFTRRAEAYPGPGIIPADGRGFYTTLEYNF